MTRVISTLLLVFCSAMIGAEELSQQEIEQKLKALEDEISKYREVLDSTEGKKSDVEKNLEKNEKGISDLIIRIEGIEEELDTSQNRVSRLSEEQEELLIAKSEQQGYIERQIRAAYEIGNQAYLKVLLNQEDPDEINRMLIFYDYFNEARAAQIKAYNRTLVDLDRVSLTLAREIDLLDRNRLALRKEQEALVLTQQKKRQALKALISQIRSTGTELTRLQQNRDSLEQILKKIENSLANLPTPGEASPFSSMQGSMPMPVNGKIARRFGHPRNAGKLKWDGIFIEADEGEPVFAIHYGRVVFSDWLRGFGLLMIISHGEGYMSLYGHNEVLYRQTGDWVTAGDMIATVGNSGGQNRAGLYFEIRISGKPSDPQKWCIAPEQNTA